MTKSAFLFILSLFIVSCAGDSFSTSSDSAYPTRYCILSEAEREGLFKSFDADFKEYFEVDSFGFIEIRGGKLLDSEVFSGKINDKTQALQLAIGFIRQNNKFYGISNVLQLEPEDINGSWASYGGKFQQESEADVNRWIIRFKNQNFNGIEVYNTKIGIYLSPRVVYWTYGHWYRDIYLPQNEKVSFEEAKQSLVGKTFGYSDWTGHKEHTITERDFNSGDTGLRMLVPFRKNRCTEIRLCWKIQSKTIWNFYVDVVTGELIFSEQTIIF